MELSESFYIFLTTSSVGLILAFLKIAYDSKCKNIKLCCLEIERDIEHEASIEHDRIEHGIIDTRQSLDRPTSQAAAN